MISAPFFLQDFSNCGHKSGIRAFVKNPAIDQAVSDFVSDFEKQYGPEP
jgi:hypothetical protein